jgi:hypothetical protein
MEFVRPRGPQQEPIMHPLAHTTFRVLATAACLAPVSYAAAIEARANPDVGFISAVKGKPQVQYVGGRTETAIVTRQLSPGVKVTLAPNESFKFCHESASKTFSVEGAGSVSIGDIGVNTEAGGPKVVVSGVCNSSSTPSETGGILSRGGLKPASSPK